MTSPGKWIGYARLAELYDITPVQPLLVQSEIGSTRKTTASPQFIRETYQEGMRPEDTLAGQLAFALKHEGIHLEFLARLMRKVPEIELATWINSERTGQYARRAGFLWEWFSGRTLQGVQDTHMGNYIDALDSSAYLTRTHPTNNRRWRVRDNMPGDRRFCPLIRLTPALAQAEDYNCAELLNSLEAEYGQDILMRSAVWLTVKESRASFQIEREADKTDRIKRFAAVLESRCGTYPNPLDPATLAELQQEVMGDKTTLSQFGLRKSPVFVGETIGYKEIVHYIAPHWDDLQEMLQGLSAFIERTQGKSSIQRAAAAAFGFVYIHPLADGNGRLHRFLINHILRRDGAIPKPFILPISATITGKAVRRVQYDAALETLSKPLMTRYGSAYSFQSSSQMFDDGIASNFVFDRYEDANLAWRYIDLTTHAQYLAELIEATIRQEMRDEARTLQSWDTARAEIKEVIDGPNQDIDRIIRSIKDNQGRVSNKLTEEFPVLADTEATEKIVHIIDQAFAPHFKPA